MVRYLPLGFRRGLGKVLSRLPFIPFLTPVGQATLSIANKRRGVLDIGTHATKVIAPSRAIGTALIRNGIPDDKVTHIGHGIPALERRPLNPGLGQRPFKFLYFGRINYVKGIHVLLEAARGLEGESFELHIAGNAVTKPEDRYLEKLRTTFNSVNLVWHTNAPIDDVPKLIGNSDMVVHPTICLEVFGLTITESLAVGRPVIATRCGGAEEQIRDGDNGVLVSPNDVDGLRAAMRRVIDQPQLVETMAACAGEVKSMHAHAGELENIYRSCIGKA
jgi:glycosyltransferase involved in cell wall biosynthesis